MLRIAVLGCGRIGRMHAANIAAHPRAELATVFDIDQSSAETVAAQHGVRASRSADDVFASPDVDAVLVATVRPTRMPTTSKRRSPRASRCSARSRSISAWKGLTAAPKRSCRKACRFRSASTAGSTPVTARLGTPSRSGDIGDLHQVVITSRDPGMPPRSYYEVAGGLFRDMTIHDFDLARFMLGEEPEEVFAIGGRLIDPAMMKELNDYDSVMVVMRTASGKQCHINNSRTSTYGYDQRVELLGTTGMVISGNRKPHELRLYSDARTEAAAPYLDFFIERYREAFDAEIDAFVTCVEKGEPPEVGFEDGRRALVLAEAAMKSAAEGRFVKVSEIG